MVLGLALYFQHRKFWQPPPTVLVWLMMAPHYGRPIDDPSIAPLFGEYGEAFRALRKALGNDGRLRVYCETDAMARAYEPHVGLKIATVLVHKMIRQPRSRRLRPDGGPVTIVCAGDVNAAKGYSLLPDAIDNLNRQRSDLKFLIHGTVAQTDYPEGWQVLQRLSKLAPNVTVRTDVFSEDEYLAWLAKADLVLLPYDPRIYRTRGSGICAEATMLGIPVIAPEGCDFSCSAIREGRAAAIQEFSANAVAAAVLTAVEHLDEVASRAAEYAASHAARGDTLRAELAAAASASRRRGLLKRMLAR
jgi:glycosyltransferase involved in cell wall biosynthesis